jgi:hypothetical protein
MILRVFSRNLIEEGRSGGLKAARILSNAIEAHMKGSSDYKLWIFCFMNRRGLVTPLSIAENTLNSFIGGFNQVVRSFVIDVGYGKGMGKPLRAFSCLCTLQSWPIIVFEVCVQFLWHDCVLKFMPELMIEETRSYHTMRVYFGGMAHHELKHT